MVRRYTRVAARSGCSPLADGAWPRKIRCAAQGDTTKATAREKSIAGDAPVGIGRMYGPMSPRTKAMGRMAAITVKVARIVGLPTSSTASTAVRAKRPARLLAMVALDVLHHHDGVVHQDADGEDQREEGHAVQGVAGQEVDEEGQGEGDRHRDADHQPAAPAHGQGDEGHDGQGRDEQVLDQLVALLARRLAVVARDVHADVRGKQLRTECLDLGQGLLGEGGRVRARALGESEGHGGMLDAGGVFRGRGPRPAGEGYDRGRLVGPIHDPRHVAHVDGPAGLHAHDHAADVRSAPEERAGFEAYLAVSAHGRAGLQACAAGLQRARERGPAHALPRHAVRRRLDPHHARLAADDRGLRRVRQLRQLLRQFLGDLTQGVAVVGRAREGEGQEGDVVDRVQLHARRSRARRHLPTQGGQPLVDLHQAPLVLLVHEEPDGDQRQARPRRAVDVLDAREPPHRPLERVEEPALHLRHVGAGPGHRHVHHRHPDLRLLFARRDQERERAQARARRR